MRRVHTTPSARTPSILVLALLAFTFSPGAQAAQPAETPDTTPAVTASPGPTPVATPDPDPATATPDAIPTTAAPDPAPTTATPDPDPTTAPSPALPAAVPPTSAPVPVLPVPTDPVPTVPSPTDPVPTVPAPAPGPAEPENQYVVLYAAGTDVAAEVDELREDGTVVDQTFTQAPAAAVTLTASEAAVLETAPGVEAVEPDSLISALDTQPGAPWGLDRSDQRTLPLSGAYTTPSTGAGVTVYVVDTGVNAAHSDFAGRVAPGWSAIAGSPGTQDCNGHGTHIAGTIAGRTYGIAKGATLVPVRVLACDGKGTLSGLLAGIDWIVAHHPSGTPAVANFSLGGVSSVTLDASLQTMVDDGVSAVVAAGNNSADACGLSPARFPAAVTVAASTPTDGQASFTNVGRCVDLYAPGQNIVSASHTSSTGSATKSGTSTATPHVSGAAALLLSENRALTPAQVSAALVSRATTGVVKNVSAGTPNRLLYVPPTSGAAAARPAATQPAAAPNATPIGFVDAVTTTSTSITTRGWALDPDTTASIAVHVYVDGRATGVLAKAPRPDLAGFNRGTAHGYTLTTPATPGTHRVCVYAINATPGPNPLLGCRTVTV